MIVGRFVAGALLLAQFTSNEADYWRYRTGVTPENVCFLRALDLNPCPTPPLRPKGTAPERGWGSNGTAKY